MKRTRHTERVIEKLRQADVALGKLPSPLDDRADCKLAPQLPTPRREVRVLLLPLPRIRQARMPPHGGQTVLRCALGIASAGPHIIREAPIQIAGYSIYLKRGDFKKKASPEDELVPDDKWHARVLISRERSKELRATFLDIACHRKVESLVAEINGPPFEPYKPVWRHLRKLVHLINKKRKAAGYSPVPMTAVRLRRTIVKAFEPLEIDDAA